RSQMAEMVEKSNFGYESGTYRVPDNRVGFAEFRTPIGWLVI
ncbi:4106_t:CDS:1, partial [Diversispora eburnea]